MHGEGKRSPNCDIQINPELLHVSGPEPKSSSPGSKISFFGVALVVTEMMPAGVTMDAVTETGIHNNGLTQIHVPTPTNPRRAGGAKLPISLEGSGTGGWRRWTGWAWTGRSSNTAFRRLETTYRGALETAVASRILAAAALVLALITVGTERPIAQRVLEVATSARGDCSIGSGSIRGVYTTKSRDHHVRSISINVGYRGE